MTTRFDQKRCVGRFQYPLEIIAVCPARYNSAEYLHGAFAFVGFQYCALVGELQGRLFRVLIMKQPNIHRQIIAFVVYFAKRRCDHVSADSVSNYRLRLRP